MRTRLLVLVLASPIALAAQAPLRLAEGACDWKDRADAVWGSAVRSYSSQFDANRWAATQALGKPDVWPRYGDLPGAWAPGSAMNLADQLEIVFPAPVMTNELWVFETNGAGGVYAVSAIAPDGAIQPLAVATPAQLKAGATQIVVPVEPARLVAGIRINTSSAVADTYGEIDAVAAVPERVCSAGTEVRVAATATRLPPDSVPAVPAGVVWANGIMRQSSEFDPKGWGASDALGEPNVFPRFGDIPGAWAPAKSTSIVEFLVLQFPSTPTQDIVVYETFGVGGLWLIEDMSGGTPVALWADTPGVASSGQARQLRIHLPQPRTISALRIVTAPAAVRAYPEIDAVGLVPPPSGGQ